MASIRRRKDRESGWIVDCRDVPGGRRLTVATREQAELLRAKMVQESQQSDIKLDTYAERWLEQIASSVDARTLTSYRENLRLYIRPVFGNVMVRAIHRGHIKALLARKRADRLSKNTVRLIRATLSVMLGDAVDDGIIQLNPALGIGRRGRKRPDTITPADRQKQVRAMTYEQLATFSRSLDGSVLTPERGAPPDPGRCRASPGRSVRDAVDGLRPRSLDPADRTNSGQHRPREDDEDG